MTAHDSFSLMIHGGAGGLGELRDPALAAAYEVSLRRILALGRELLHGGADALDVVVACARQLEDDALFNAGIGSVLNEAGQVEMDAAVMDGRDLSAGAVAGVRNIANPTELAWLVMTRTPHVLLIGEGAMALAHAQGMAHVPDERFRIPLRVAQLAKARKRQTTLLDHADMDMDMDMDMDPELGPDGNGKFGTVGAVACDRAGNLAAATSTGGMTNKAVGRVGDSPIIGAGVYADNASCAVSATGHGEDFLRCVTAKTIADLIELQGMDAVAATHAALETLQRRVQGLGGVIVIDRQGRCAGGFTTRAMIHGWIEWGGEAQTRVQPGTPDPAGTL